MRSEKKEEFRNYQNSEFQDRVSLFYFQQHSQQTFEYVCKMRNEFSSLNKTEMSIWEAAELLNEIVDQR